MIEKLNIRKALDLLWDLKKKNLENLEYEARPRFAKIFDKVICERRYKKDRRANSKYL